MNNKFLSFFIDRIIGDALVLLFEIRCESRSITSTILDTVSSKSVLYLEDATTYRLGEDRYGIVVRFVGGKLA